MADKKILVEKINLLFCHNHNDRIAIYRIMGENKKTRYICQECFDELKKLYDVNFIRSTDLTIKKRFKTKSIVETSNKPTWISLIPPRKLSRFVKRELKNALEKNLSDGEIKKAIDDIEKKSYNDAIKQKENKKLNLFSQFEEARLLGKDCTYSTSYQTLKAKEHNNLIFAFTDLDQPLFIVDRSGKILEYYSQF